MCWLVGSLLCQKTMAVKMMFLIVLIFCPYLYARELSAGIKAQIDDFMTRIIQCRGIPGVSLGVVLGDQEYATGYGFADLETNRRVDNKTLFNIASLTKGFTAAVIADVMERSNDGFHWDSKVRDLLGKDYRFVDEMRTYETTLKDLLAHRMGLDRADIALHAGYSDNVTREDLSSRLRFLQESIPFRDAFLYSNMMYMLAAHIVEKKTGKTWEELIQERIFDPLGMNSSTFLPSFPTQENIAFPYGFRDDGVTLQKDDLGIYSFHPADPAAAICSNSEDMIKWMSHMLSVKNESMKTRFPFSRRLKETLDEVVLLSPGFRSFRMIQKPIFPVDNIPVAYSMGWMTSYYRGLTRYYHDGDVYSYSSLLCLYPQLNLGLYVSFNGPGTHEAFDYLNVILYYLTDLLGGYQPWLDITTSCTFPLPWKQEEFFNETNYYPPITDLQRPTEEYVGVYGNGVVGNVVIEKSANGKNLSYQLGKNLRGDLLPTGDAKILISNFKGPLAHQKQFRTFSDFDLTFTKNYNRDVFDTVTIYFGWDQYNFTRGLLFENALSGTSTSTLANRTTSITVFLAFYVFSVLY